MIYYRQQQSSFFLQCIQIITCLFIIVLSVETPNLGEKGGQKNNQVIQIK